MLETSARLLALLSLLGSRRFWSGAALAERLAVTERTVRRDVDKLRSLGYPVSSSAGVAGGYHLGAGASLPPLLLDESEALAVALGLHSAAAGSVSGMEEAAVRALAKLDQVLPLRLRKRVKAVVASVAPMHLATPNVDAEVLTGLASACRDEERVTFRYEDRAGRSTQRRIEPHGLVHSGSRWYLAAWDLDREDFRTFRVDRIGRVRPEGRRFQRRPVPGGSVTVYVSRSVASGGYDARVRVMLEAPYEDMVQRISPLTGTLERFDAERCVLECGGRSFASLGLYIAHFAVDFQVLEPPEFAQHLQRMSRRLARAARGAPKQA